MKSKMVKKTVLYDVSKGAAIRVGSSALVYPLNHTDLENVSNNELATTSTVLNYCPDTGVFETRNSIYKPFNPCQIDATPSLPMSMMCDNDY